MNREIRLLEQIHAAFNWFFLGIITSVYFFPVAAESLVLSIFDSTRKQIHSFVSFWAKSILFVCPVMKVRLQGMEKLVKDEPYVFVANHQSLTDILAVLHLKHPFKFIAKKELFWIPFFGWSLYAAGYIPLMRGDQQSGKEALQRARFYLKRGVSVLFFPEGTRSPDGEIKDFKFGAFKLASEMNIRVAPLVIDGTRNVLPKGSRLIGRSVQVIVKAEEPLSAKGDIQKLTREVREKMVRSLQEIRLKNMNEQSGAQEIIAEMA